MEDRNFGWVNRRQSGVYRQNNSVYQSVSGAVKQVADQISRLSYLSETNG